MTHFLDKDIYVFLLAAESKSRVFVAVVEMLRWFAGQQIRNTAVCHSCFILYAPMIRKKKMHDNDFFSVLPFFCLVCLSSLHFKNLISLALLAEPQPPT